MFALGICLMLVSAAAMAQTPADAVADAVANSGVFPAGTTVVSVSAIGDSIIVELSAEAVTADFGDTLADNMVEAICAAVGEFPELTNIEVTVGGQPLWSYLPAPTEQPAGSGLGALSLGSPVGGILSSQSPIVPPIIAAPTSSELAGKLVVLHPSHGSYVYSTTAGWYRSMRTYCGPNPVTSPPPLGGAAYQPSDYYYWTMGFQWPMSYEDEMSPETIRFLYAYCQSSGAATFCSRNLDKTAGNFPAGWGGYPNKGNATAYPVPKWRAGAKYNLQDKGVPEWVWNEPSLTTQADKDLRARPYYANYLMETLGYNEDNSVSFSLHTNAAGAGTARGTETYWYTTKYPYLQTRAQAFCAQMEAGVVGAIRNQYDGVWAEPIYKTPPPARPEWPTAPTTAISRTVGLRPDGRIEA